MPSIKTQIVHSHKVVQGFNKLIEMKAIKIMGSTIFLHPELWGSTKEKQNAWMKNAYRFLRLEHKIKEGSPLYFKDIDSLQLIGKYEK
ncbi:MAG: hypothetical protein JXR07_19940 [Reichenbachiella sp.]